MGVHGFIPGVPTFSQGKDVAIHHVIVQDWICSSSDFEGFVATSSCHKSQKRNQNGGGNRPAMMALVEAIAGMMFLTTPCVREYVTPVILNSFARLDAVSNNH
jgi:hypothetical protein